MIPNVINASNEASKRLTFLSRRRAEGEEPERRWLMSSEEFVYLEW